MDMNKWLYRAVGTVGLASGFWLLGGGTAQAHEADAPMPTADPQQLRGLLDDLFTPAGGADLGLSRLGVPQLNGLLGSDSPVGGVSQLSGVTQISGADAGPSRRGGAVSSAPTRRAATVLPDVAGQDSILGGALPDLAGGQPAAGLVPGGALGLLPAAPSSPTAGVDHRALIQTPGAEREELLPSLPLVGGLPIVGGLTGGGLPNVANGLPIQGDDLGGSARGALGLPAIGDVASVLPADARSALADELGPAGVSARPTADAADSDVPAVIGDDLTAQRPDLFAGPASAEGLPVLGALDDGPLAGLPVVGGIARNASAMDSMPLVGSLPIVDKLPIFDSLAGDQDALAGSAVGDQQALTPDMSTTRRGFAPTANERPVAGDDMEYLESDVTGSPLSAAALPALPTLGDLPLLGQVKRLPVSDDPSSLPTLPVVGQLTSPLSALRTLPALGGLVPGS
jgi:hypothetical protein